ncbi:MAG: xanthan lyase [Prevotella sp.]|nr:xanthan lyase [Prevotella sp.]
MLATTAAQAQEKVTWGNIDYKGEPWVKNVSRPNEISEGLQNRHLSLWASHGYYYDQAKGFWKWQRPFLFGTTEDLFTQTIVVPYLIPMLENAGAVVFTPRERDWQKHEIIIDNDDPTPYYYMEQAGSHSWTTTNLPGFAYHLGAYYDGENPFEAGTARMVKATRKASNTSHAVYQPSFPESGRYAVYVSYQTLENSVPNAEYTVFHKGQQTIFHVNQQMGDGTWVYLGTFDFDKGYSERNRVILSNQSNYDGVVTTDAVRFGGGMGNITRGGSVSGMARSFEGARYYAQWAGAPYSAYSSKNGENDYADDINVRSLMTNWLAGGSPYAPNTEGKRVPIEMTLAIHSDAGYNPDGQSVYGPLAICTTNFNDGLLDAGISRQASFNLAEEVLSGEVRDMSRIYGEWPRRNFYDRNYSETRVPAVPSAIIETLSHQSFPDMRYGQDPNFRFNLARSIYKSVLRHVSKMHDEDYTVQPLAPDHFRIELVGKDKIKLSWEAVADSLEHSARPTGYIVYTAIGDGNFDNGEYVKSTSLTLRIDPYVPYHFRVTATNKGGESFPTQVLSTAWVPEAQHTVLIVDGFQRLAAPYAIINDSLQGFDLDADLGISYGLTAGWSGRQQCFDRMKMGIEGPGGLGFCGDEMAGYYIQGNTFDYVRTHAKAIATAKQYNIVSCSREALEDGDIHRKRYDCIDLILGVQKHDHHALKSYKTFTLELQRMLQRFLKQHGRLLVSGAFVASDMQSPHEQQFLAENLRIMFGGTQWNALGQRSLIVGLGMKFNIFNQLNDKHYAATASDIVQPLSTAYCAMQYADGTSAAVAYEGSDCKVFSVGFPLECIREQAAREGIFRGIMNFLLK